MITLWTNEQLHNANAKQKKFVALFGIVTAIWLAVSFVLLFVSTDKYLPYLVADIVFAVIYGWWAVYAWNVVYFDLNAKRKLFVAMSNALPDTNKLIFRQTSGERTINNVAMQVLCFDDKDGNLREAYCLDKVDLQVGATYIVYTCANVVTCYKECATNE